MEELKEIRQHLKLVQEIEPCGLRGLEEMTGVSFSTLSRFLRGADPDIKTLSKLRRFKNGEEKVITKPKVVKRFCLGKKTFLVTIEQLD